METEVHLLGQQAVFLYIGYAPPCGDQICPKINLRKSLFWLTVRGYSLQHWRRPGGEELPSLESDDHCCLARFRHLVQSGTGTHGMVLPTVRIHLPISINLISIISLGLTRSSPHPLLPYTHAQRFVSQMIPNSVKLTVTATTPSPHLPSKYFHLSFRINTNL